MELVQTKIEEVAPVEESLSVQLGRILVVNVTAFFSGKAATHIFDKVIEIRKNKVNNA